MKTKHYSSLIKKEALSSINFFKLRDENLNSDEHAELSSDIEKAESEILHFIIENEETEFNEFLKKYNEEYGGFLSQYREMKKVKQLTAIKKIAVYFFVISVISIVTGIIISISILTQ